MLYTSKMLYTLSLRDMDDPPILKNHEVRGAVIDSRRCQGKGKRGLQLTGKATSHVEWRWIPSTLPGKEWGICFFLILATLTVYWNVPGFDFIRYDDPQYVLENPVVQGGLSGRVSFGPSGTSAQAIGIP
jgi:hypothetical protein